MDFTRSKLDGCGLEGAAAVMDCSEFPCIFQVPPDDRAAVAECMGKDVEDLEDGRVAIFGYRPLPETWDRVEQREDFRFAGLDRAVNGPSVVMDTVDLLSCEEITQQATDPTDCATVAERLGCQEPDPELLIPEYLVDAYVDEVHTHLEDLAESCESFGSGAWFLDCDSLPCVLGIDRLDMGGRELDEYLCGDISSRDRRNISTDMVLIPVLKLGPDEMRAANLGRWERDRRIRLLSAFSYLVAPPVPGKSK